MHDFLSSLNTVDNSSVLVVNFICDYLFLFVLHVDIVAIDFTSTFLSVVEVLVLSFNLNSLEIVFLLT